MLITLSSNADGRVGRDIHPLGVVTEVLVIRP